MFTLKMLAAISLIVLGASSVGDAEALAIYPDNPGYFVTSEGRPLLLVGAYTWGTFSDVDYDFATMFDTLQAENLNFARIWLLWGCQRFPEPIDRLNVFPFLRPGPGTANDDLPRCDLTKFNPTFFQRLREVCDAARQRNIFLQLVLFDAWMIKHPHLWRLHAFHRNNNINNVDGDPGDTTRGTDAKRGFCSLGNPQVLEHQKLYIRQIVDAVNEFDNIMFEIANENFYSTEWERHLCKFIHQYEQNKPNRHLVMPLDLPNHSYGGVQTWDLQRLHASLLKARSLKQPIIFDTDGAGNPDNATVRRAMWTAFVSGGHIDYLDPTFQPGPEHRGDYRGSRLASQRRQLGHIRKVADRVHFWEMLPRDEVVKTGSAFVMASARELVAYLPEGGAIDLNLATLPNELHARWFDPRTGTWRQPFRFQGTGHTELTAPNGNDWVLHIHCVAQ